MIHGIVRRGVQSVVPRVARRSLLDESLDASVVGSEPQHPPDCGGNEQITFNVSQAPDEDFEPYLGRYGKRAFGIRPIVRMIVAIEHDQSGIALGDATALLKILECTRRASTPENDRAALYTFRECGIDPACPAFENLAITRALDVEQEISTS